MYKLIFALALILGSPAFGARVQPTTGSPKIEGPDTTCITPNSPAPVPYPTTGATSDLPRDDRQVMTPSDVERCSTGDDTPLSGEGDSIENIVAPKKNK